MTFWRLFSLPLGLHRVGTKRNKKNWNLEAMAEGPAPVELAEEVREDPEDNRVDCLVNRDGSLSRFRDYLLDEETSDMTFIVGPERVLMAAHQSIISHSSLELDRQLEKQNPEKPDIAILDISPDVWMIVLKYMYGVPIEPLLTHENILGCLKCAVRYQIWPLRDKCAYYIRSNLLLVDDNVPVSMLHSVNINEAIQLRRHIRANGGINIYTIQWSYVFDIAYHGLAPKVVRRLAILSLRNLSNVLLCDSIVAWFKEECRERRIPRNNRDLRTFLIRRLPHLNFPAMTPGEFYSCLDFCDELKLTPSQREFLREEVHERRRAVLTDNKDTQKNRRALRSSYMDAIVKAITFSCDKVIIVHGFGVPVFKGHPGEMTVVFVSKKSRLLERTISSGVRRIFSNTHDILYLFLRDPILIEAKTEYTMHIRAYNGTCTVIGDYMNEFKINEITFSFHSFQESFTHAIFMLFEDPRMFVEQNALTLLDLMAFVRRPSFSSDSSSDSLKDLLQGQVVYFYNADRKAESRA
uniref:Putative topoisomerase top1-interacting protein btbd1 n=1 Tax=Lutzomyia longipalpis TaxID=7200 RepID=A0A1B0CL69_LUTLO